MHLKKLSIQLNLLLQGIYKVHLDFPLDIYIEGLFYQIPTSCIVYLNQALFGLL